MYARTETAKAILQVVKSLSWATDVAQALEAEYFDVGTFDAEDLNTIGISLDDLGGCITLLQQFHKFMTNQATAQGMYRTTLNKVRRANV